MWPRPEVVGFIESCLVHNSTNKDPEGIDIEAFTDLLMLHEIAQRLANPGMSKIAPFGALRPALRPEDTVPLPTVETDDMPVDLDLTETVHNLIDFDMSGISKTSEVKADKP
jgi:hypothetical protein